jgi:hypothetical protein
MKVNFWDVFGNTPMNDDLRAAVQLVVARGRLWLLWGRWAVVKLEKAGEINRSLYEAFNEQWQARTDLTEQMANAATVLDEDRYARRMHSLRQENIKLDERERALNAKAHNISDTTYKVGEVCEDLRSVVKTGGRFSDDQLNKGIASLMEGELTDKALAAIEAMDMLAAKQREDSKQQALLEEQNTKRQARLDEQQAHLDEQAARIRDQKAAIAADRLVLQENKQLAIDSAVWKGHHRLMRTLAPMPPSAYGISPCFIDEERICVTNAEHPYFKAREFVKWLVRSKLMTDPKSEWCGADAVGHHLGLHNPAGKEVNGLTG